MDVDSSQAKHQAGELLKDDTTIIDTMQTKVGSTSNFVDLTQPSPS